MESISEKLLDFALSPDKLAVSKPHVDCYLLTLPLELREEIWYLSLPRSRNGVLFDDEKNIPDRWEETRSFELPIWETGNLGLLCVNHQIYNEAMPLFWKNNSFAVFVRGFDTKVAVGYQQDADTTATQHLKSFSSIDPDYSKLIKRWTLSFDTGYGRVKNTIRPRVTREKAFWDKATRSMPPRITEHEVASQYLPFRFLTGSICYSDAQSRLARKQSVFAQLCGFLESLPFVPSFSHLDLGIGESVDVDLSQDKYVAARCHSVYMHTSGNLRGSLRINCRLGAELIRFLPRLLQAGTQPVPESPEDKAWRWLELEV